MIAGKFAGEAALAAVGASYPVTVIFMAFAVGSNLGTSVIVSRLFGAKEYGRMRTAVTTAFIACVGMSLLLTAYGLFCAAHDALDSHAGGYSGGRSAVPAHLCDGPFISAVLQRMYRYLYGPLGTPKTPLYFLIGSLHWEYRSGLPVCGGVSHGRGRRGLGHLHRPGNFRGSGPVHPDRAPAQVSPGLQAQALLTPSLLWRIAAIAVPSIMQQSCSQRGQPVLCRRSSTATGLR